MRNQELYEMVTEKFVAALEAGTPPWRMPWMMRRQKNAHSGHEYRGVNRLLTAMAVEAAAERGEEYTHLWLTRKRILEMGGHIRKGEKATKVVLWKPCERKTGETDDDGKPEVETFWLLRYYNVWNLSQTEGVELPKKMAAELEGNGHDEPGAAEERAGAIWDGWADRPEERVADRAYYRPGDDSIGIPKRDDFDSPAHYWSTRFHEGVHATGHESRLNRHEAFGNGFGTEQYSKEELVAEMGAAFLMADSGLLDDSIFENSAAYLNGWLKAIKADPKLVVSAAGKAERAARHIAPVEEQAHAENAA